MVSLSSFFYLLLLQQMLQVVIACDALQFILHNLLHLFLDAPVVRLHRFLHVVVAVLVREIGNDRNFLVTRVRDKDCVKNRVKRAKIVRFTLC